MPFIGKKSRTISVLESGRTRLFARMVSLASRALASTRHHGPTIVNTGPHDPWTGETTLVNNGGFALRLEAKAVPLPAGTRHDSSASFRGSPQ